MRPNATIKRARATIQRMRKLNPRGRSLIVTADQYEATQEERPALPLDWHRIYGPYSHRVTHDVQQREHGTTAEREAHFDEETAYDESNQSAARDFAAHHLALLIER